MNNTTNKDHWEKVYQTKTPAEVSWTQEKPQTSLNLIHSFGMDKKAKIIDIGGGDSNFVDFLLEEGYQSITVLDISGKALERAQKRLGAKAEQVTWIETDIAQFNPEETYDIWHDRAAFHFLTQEEQIQQYIRITNEAVNSFMILGTFSTDGPLKCSGLEIQQYNEKSLPNLFKNSFEKLTCFTEDHITPFDTIQNFLFCSFRKL